MAGDISSLIIALRRHRPPLRPERCADKQNDSHMLMRDDRDDNVDQQIAWQWQSGMADFKRCGSKRWNWSCQVDEQRTFRTWRPR